jgi:membrane protease YdiL (CAAX protease family)
LVAAAASTLPVFQSLARHPFHRFVSRSLLILALAGIWPFLRSVGVRRWRDVGFRAQGMRGRLANGFLFGFVSLGTIALLAILGGARAWDIDPSGTRVARQLMNAALSAVVVGVIEEVFFRGTIFGAFRRVWTWPAALAASSAIYALVHFFERPESPATVVWTSGFPVLLGMLAGFTHWTALVPGFLNLFLAGGILAYGYQRTGSLFFSIGLHGGWIFWLKAYGALTDEVAGANLWWWGTKKLVDGWLAFFILLVTFGAVIWWHDFRRTENQPRQNGRGQSGELEKLE